MSFLDIIPIAQHNAQANLSYLVYSDNTREAILVDPFSGQLCLEKARAHQLKIIGVINTHEHFDHCAGNQYVLEHTQASLLSGTSDGSECGLGSIRLQCISLPGHTPEHIGILVQLKNAPGLLCGDTLFNAGCGNCMHGGNVQSLYQSVQKLQRLLRPETLIFFGHDYREKNIAFIRAIQPEEKTLMDYEKRFSPAKPWKASTWEEECQVNPFLKLDCPKLRQALVQNSYLAANENTEPAVIFEILRSLRDHW